MSVQLDVSFLPDSGNQASIYSPFSGMAFSQIISSTLCSDLTVFLFNFTFL